jgi:hypothetical protein
MAATFSLKIPSSVKNNLKAWSYQDTVIEGVQGKGARTRVLYAGPNRSMFYAYGRPDSSLIGLYTITSGNSLVYSGSVAKEAVKAIQSLSGSKENPAGIPIKDSKALYNAIDSAAKAYVEEGSWDQVANAQKVSYGYAKFFNNVYRVERGHGLINEVKRKQDFGRAFRFYLKQYYKNMPSSRKSNPHPEQYELEIYIESDSQLYRSQHQPIQKNLINKMAAGKYQHNLAVKLFGYLVDAGAKKYAKEFGGTWNQIFSVADRKAVAESLTNSFEAEAKLGNYDGYLAKKYQKKSNPTSYNHTNQLTGKESNLDPKNFEAAALASQYYPKFLKQYGKQAAKGFAVRQLVTSGVSKALATKWVNYQVKVQNAYLKSRKGKKSNPKDTAKSSTYNARLTAEDYRPQIAKQARTLVTAYPGKSYKWFKDNLDRFIKAGNNNPANIPPGYKLVLMSEVSKCIRGSK